MSNMYGVRISWVEFKNLLDLKIPFKEISLTGSLRLIAIDGDSKFQCIIHTDGDMSDEYAEYQANYQTNKNTVIKETDSSGRAITKPAATQKGWHYQVHSVSFEVGKKDSTYNKDDNGNDLGYTEIKFYDHIDIEQATDITDQSQLFIDANAKKTVVRWCPTYDFEIISGSIKQISKKNTDIFLYVNAKVVTGYPAPNDWLKVPFIQGGINLNYIGADEPLETNGRASKHFNGSLGDHFEIVVNHEIIEKHKITILFETYKDPLS